MNQRRRKGQIYSMLVGILFCCVGCGLQQEKQDQETSQVATGAALCIEEDYHSEKIQHQLGLLVDNAHKWRLAKDGGSAGMVRYAVTDLDRNGRLEIMALKEGEMVYEYFLQDFFEINASEDGIEEIETDSVGEVYLGDDELLELEYAYYDPKTGECHYVIENELSEEEMLSDESVDYGENIMALTLRQGKLSCDTLACQEQSENQQGKMQSRFYQMDGTEKTEMDPSEYTVEKVADAVYADCGKYNLRFSLFFFDHSLEDMTEKQMHYALEKSYRESFMGYPLGQQEKKVAGQKIRIPQYSTMQDGKKQKRINQIIVKQVEKILHRFDDAKGKRNVDISIKYAGGDKVSLLLQVSRPAPREQQKDTEFFEEVAQEGAIWDTINIDLEQGSLLSKQEFLQESVRQEVMVEVEMDLEDEMEGYEESDKNQDSDHLYGNILENLKKWQEISLYQSSGGIGLVIPTSLASAPFVIYELWNEWDEAEWDGGVSFAEIDWEAYQYKMLASEYQDLQDYMPVLTGEAQFIYQWEEDEEEAAKSENMTISGWVKEYFDEEAAEVFLVNEVCICDLTQDGKPELILDIFNSFYLILHKEGNTYYGTLKGRRSLYGLQTNGVYGAGKGDYYFYQMHFEKDHFIDEYLGGYEYPAQTENFKEEDVKYYIRDQRVEKDSYEKWEKSIMTEEVSWYRPEALEKR